MINAKDIKKGDKFNIITNGTVDGFMVKAQQEEKGEEFIVPMTVDYYNEKIERFEKI